MSAMELLENAIKYGAWHTAPDATVDLTIEVDRHCAVIEVQNPITDDDSALRALDETIQWIRGFQSHPFHDRNLAKRDRNSERATKGIDSQART
jgi:hypothetical protein